MKTLDNKTTKKILQKYSRLNFIKKETGKYMIKDVLNIDIEDEDAFMNKFDKVLKKLKSCPLDGELFYDLITKRFIEDISVNDICEMYHVKNSVVYRKSEEAVKLITLLFNGM